MKLNKEKKQALLKKHWYFQGFNATPALLSTPTLGDIKDCWDVLGYGYTTDVQFYEGDKCYFLYDWEDLERNLQMILQKTKENKNYPLWLIQKDKELREAHEKIVRKLENMDIQMLSFKEAMKLYHEFNISYRHAITVGLIIECFTYPTEDIIRNTIRDELSAKAREMDTEQVQTLLTSALQPSFIGSHHLCLLRFAADIKKKNLSKLSLENFAKSNFLTELKKSDIKLFKRIQIYQQKYFWMANAYAGAQVLPLTHFIHEIQEALKKYPEPEKELQRMEQHFATIKQRKKECIEKYNFSEQLKMLILINDAIGIIHDKRKEVITHANHFLDEFLKRFGKEKNIPLEEIRYLSEYEITEQGLKKINSQELKKRKQKSVFITFHKGKQYILTGKEAEDFVKGLTKEHQLEEQGILKGYCASQGHAIGIVKICRGLEEIPKLNKGDILVACMTQPEFVPAMKRAAAIVTDEGGLTCHAAIISRELNKPCVVSTKKATRVLKDGMTVEVNATEGYVKKCYQKKQY